MEQGGKDNQPGYDTPHGRGVLADRVSQCRRHRQGKRRAHGRYKGRDRVRPQNGAAAVPQILISGNAPLFRDKGVAAAYQRVLVRKRGNNQQKERHGAHQRHKHKNGMRENSRVSASLAHVLRPL